MGGARVAEPPWLRQGPSTQPLASASTQQKLLQLQWALRLPQYVLMKGLMFLLKPCLLCCAPAH